MAAALRRYSEYGKQNGSSSEHDANSNCTGTRWRRRSTGRCRTVWSRFLSHSLTECGGHAAAASL